MKDLILKHVLANAVEHEGRADVGAVLGKIIAERPDLREKIKEIIPDVKKVVKEVNGWTIKKQESRLKKFKYKKVEKVERVGLPPLPNAVKGKVITRFPPYPSGALHIGNMKAAVTSHEYAKMYDGKFVVRIEDTDPDPEKITKENVEMIKKDLDALGLKADIFYLCSSRFEKQYEYGERLIREGKVYVCTCKATGVKDKAATAKETCECRNRSVEENLNLFKKMFGDFKEGEAVVRLKTDINDPNPALRDPALLRIKEGVHPITGKEHRVYPLYNFNCAVEDHDYGITHVLRGTEHATNTLIQKKIYEALGWEIFPHVINFGFLYMPGEKVHKRFIRDAIKEGKFTGWDDPRLGQYGLIRALIRRGIRPEAIKNMIVEMGVNPQTVHFEWEKLYTENRKIIDPIANRYFAVLEPVKISVKKAARIKNVKAKLHPEFPKRGSRKIPVNVEKIYIEKEDFEKMKNKEIGLMNLFSVKLKKEAEFISKKIKMESQKMQWVSEPNAKIRIIMPDGVEVGAAAEPDIKKVKEGQILQLVRIGFCRVDKVNKDIVLYYAHK
jgi:glutamyl-tRNA synthetase